MYGRVPSSLRTASAMFVVAVVCALFLSAAPAFAAGSISGTVTRTDTAAPIEGVTVYAYGWNGSQWWYYTETPTLADGTYVLAGLPDNSYLVQFWMGDEYRYEYYPDAPDQGGATPLVVSGDMHTDINGTLEPLASIEGTVTASDTGLGLQTVMAGLYKWQEPWWGGDLDWVWQHGIYTDADGHYRLTGLEEGDYRLQFVDQSAYRYLSEYWDNASDLYTDATTIQVAAAQAVTGKDVVLQLGGSISGHVANTLAEGLDSIDVIAYQPDGMGGLNYMGYGYTDFSGDYHVEGLPTGSYYVYFNDYYGTYAPQYYPAAAEWASADTVDVVVGEDTPGIDAVLGVAGRITGTVFAPDETTALESIYVTAWQFGDVGSGYDTWTQVGYDYTDWEGAFDIGGLTTGTYSVRFEDYTDTYLDECYNDKPNLDSSDPISVTTGQTQSGINAVLGVPGYIEGYVTNADSDPVADIYVTFLRWQAYPEGGGEWTFADSAYADWTGHFCSPGLAEGDYVVKYQDHYGRGYVTNYYPDSLTAGAATPVTVIAGEYADASAVMLQGGRITGQVTDGYSNLEGITAYAMVDDPMWGWSSVASDDTDANGLYEILGLPTGTYRVLFEDVSDGVYISEYFDGKYDAESADPVDVTLGMTTASINAVLTEGARIHGTVTDPYSDPLDGIDVNLYAEDGQGGWDWRTGVSSGWDGPGTYTIGGLPTGNYTLSFSDYTNGVYATQWYSGQSSMATADSTLIEAPGEYYGYNAQMEFRGSISGTVWNEAASELESITVTAFIDDADWGWTWAASGLTEPDGTYQMTGVDPGAYVVEFYDESGMYLWEYFDNKSSLESADPVVVLVGSDTGSIDATLTEGGHITGTVTDPDGLPVEDAWVTVHKNEGDWWEQWASDQTDTLGVYDVGGLPTGTYRVEFIPNDSALTTEYWNNTYDFDLATPVEVTAGTTTADIDAQFEIGGSISGNVSADAGGAIEGAAVMVFDADWDPMWFEAGDPWYTDKNGDYVIGGLPGGQYYVIAGCDPALGLAGEYYNDTYVREESDPVSVAMGVETPGIDIGLAASSASISGTVTLAEGGPALGGWVWVEPLDVPYPANWYLAGWAELGADGTYSMTSLMPGDYVVSFDYWPDFGDWRGEYYDNVPYDLPELADELAITGLDTVHTGIDAVLGESGQLNVMVGDELSNPLEGILVRVYYDAGADGLFEVASGYSGALGDLGLPYLFPGDYRVSFEDPLGVLPTLWYSGATSPELATPVTVPTGDATLITQMLFGDAAAPNTTSDIDEAWQQGPVWVTLNAEDVGSAGVAATYYAVDGVPTADPAYLYGGAFEITAEETHTVRFFSVDTFGNVEDMNEKLVRIDNTTPTCWTNIDTNWHAAPFEVVIEAADTLSQVEDIFYTLDGLGPFGYVAPFEVSAGVEVVSWVVDYAGNASDYNYETPQIDANAPTTTSNINSAWRNSATSVTLTADDDESGVLETYYKLTGENVSSEATVTYAGSFEVSFEGTTTVTYWSVDAVGNVEEPTSQDIRIDRTAPTVTSDLKSGYVGSATITLTGYDEGIGGTTIYHKVDGGEYGLGLTFEVTGLGQHSIEYYAVDMFGQFSGYYGPFYFNIVASDDIAPVTTIDAGDEGAWSAARLITITAQDNEGGTGVDQVFYTVDGGDPIEYTEPFTLDTHGEHSLTAWAVDNNSNTGAADTATAKVDVTAPTTEATGIDADWHNSEVSVSLNPSDTGVGSSTTYYRIGGTGAYQTGTSFTVSQDGTNTIEFYSIDGVGNAEEVKSATVKVDMTGPVITVDKATGTYPVPLSVNITSADALTGPMDLVVEKDGVVIPGGTATAHSFSFDTPGVYEITYSAQDNLGNRTSGSRTYTVVQDYTAVPVQGDSRYATAVVASQKVYPAGSVNTVVIASGANWPDALGGGALAGALGGPVLLVKPTELPTVVADEIARLGADHAIVVGGPGAVGDVVMAALDTLPGVGVERLGGGSRYDTARLVAERTKAELGTAYDGTVFLSTGSNYPDALAASPLATAKGWPILLTKPDALPAETVLALTNLDATKVLVLGGTGAVSDAAKIQAEGIVGATATRLSGTTRFATAVNIATYGVDHAGLKWDGMALATGRNFPDALAGGCAQGVRGSVILLTEVTTLSPETGAAITAHQDVIHEVWFLGGPSAISDAVRAAVAGILSE